MRSSRSMALALPTSSNPARYGHAGRTRLVNMYSTAEGAENKTENPSVFRQKLFLIFQHFKV
jgi:hypothetical protein